MQSAATPAGAPGWAAAPPTTDRETLAAERDADPELARRGDDRAPIAAPATRYPERSAGVLEWPGPPVQVLVHAAHARSHGALFLPEAGVLLAGDMLSDVEIPLLDLSADDPVGDYLAALTLLESVGAGTVVPGHGRVGHGDELRRRIEADRRYLAALMAGLDARDERCALPWAAAVHAAQRDAVTG